MSFEDPLIPLRRRVRLLLYELSMAFQWDSACILLASYRSEITRARIQSSLKRSLKRLGQSVLDMKVSKTEYDMPLILRDHPMRSKVVYFVSGLQWAGGKGYSNAYRALNMHREYLVEARIRCVFWLTQSEFKKIPRHAPDFWAFRHKVVDFPELPSQQDIVLAGYKGEDPASAIERHQKALQHNFKNPSIHQELAELYRAAGCYDEAMFYYKRSIRLAPGNAQYLLGLAQIQSDMGQADLARRTKIKAARLSVDGIVEGTVHA